MEVVIPPRDHGPSTYQYRWDENGEVTHITRIKEQDPPSSIQERLRKGRQTVQWPFQSISTETEISFPPTAAGAGAPPPFARRATWEPKRVLGGDADSDLIPDYVINYIRGETPETVARRKRNGGKLAERRGVDTYEQHRVHQSRTADFEGFVGGGGVGGGDGGSSREGSDGASSEGGGNDELRRILAGEKGGKEVDGMGGARRRRSWSVGWRAGVGVNLMMAGLIFLAGFVCLAVAVTRGRVAGGDSVLFSGSCATAAEINWGIGGVVNVFAVGLLAGANYVFQVLSSPTRTEVSAAHHKKKWLDIGIPSVRNLVHVEGIRTLLGVVLLLLAVTTQIIYNSVISTSQTALDFKLVLVTESFVDGTSFSNGTTNNEAMLSRVDILSLQGQAVRKELVNITATECIEQFSGNFETTYSAALLITNQNSDVGSLIQTSDTRTSLRINNTPKKGTLNLINDLTPDKSTIQYCLARPGPEPICELTINTPLLGTVTALNLLTIIALSTVLFLPKLKHFTPLATLGDAISSFLQDPDPTTRGSCLLSKTDVLQDRWGTTPNNNHHNNRTSEFTTTALAGAKYFVPHDHFWYNSPSLPRWATTFLVWLASTALAATALATTLTSNPAGHLSPFGTPSKHSTILLRSSTITSRTGAAAILSSGLPHVLLGALYLVVNGLLSVFFLSHESSLFAVGPHRPLRVCGTGHAQGSQFNSLYLTVPRPVSWGLAVLFAGMGFVLGQSVFLVPLRMVGSVDSSSGAHFDGQGEDKMLLALGLSGVGLVILVGMLILLAIGVIGLGLRRAPPAAFVNGEAVGNPMTLPGGSCSAVISSRCHRVAPARSSIDGLASAGLWYGSFPALSIGDGGGAAGGEDESELWKKQLVWGVVRQGVGMNVSHASFTAGDATFLDVARSYA